MGVLVQLGTKKVWAFDVKDRAGVRESRADAL